mmetsp:Transcript_66711/g.118004  ORF Transcript_66711/g.118004 Transcript_66711/m.118004 type:complete len:109 (+) Transcript_66711:949-1275(+)
MGMSRSLNQPQTHSRAITNPSATTRSAERTSKISPKLEKGMWRSGTLTPSATVPRSATRVEKAATDLSTTTTQVVVRFGRCLSVTQRMFETKVLHLSASGDAIEEEPD